MKAAKILRFLRVIGRIELLRDFIIAETLFNVDVG